MFLNKELHLAEQLVRHAGGLALSMRDELTVSHKPLGLGPVTNADIAIDNYICSQIAAIFPDDRIVSEEGCPNPCAPIGPGRVWFVDPIDGTASYIIGNDDFAIMIGLAIDGVPRLGVVFQPRTQCLWRAVIAPDHNDTFAEIHRDEAFYKITVPLAMQPAKLTLIASRTQRSMRQTEMIKRLSPAHIIYKSSFGLKAMVIAEGGADFYVAWSNRIAKWDTCAPTTILAAAGGHVSFVSGKSLHFSGSVNHSSPILLAHFRPGQKFYQQLEDIASL